MPRRVPYLSFEDYAVAELKLTLFDGADNVRFKLGVGLENGADALASKISCPLATMAVKDSEAPIVTMTLEILFCEVL